MQRSPSAATDFTSPLDRVTTVSYDPIDQLNQFIASESFENYVKGESCDRPELPPDIDFQTMRAISTRYYRDVATVLGDGDYDEIQQGCMMSTTVHRLTIKRFLYRKGSVFYEIVIVPGAPELSYVHDTHTYDDLPIKAPDDQGLVPGSTAAHLAVENRDIATMRSIDPAVLASQDSDGETPLHYAATNGDLEMCKIIVGLNPDIVNITDNENKTAYDWALIYNHQEVCDYLMTFQ